MRIFPSEHTLKEEVHWIFRLPEDQPKIDKLSSVDQIHIKLDRFGSFLYDADRSLEDLRSKFNEEFGDFLA